VIRRVRTRLAPGCMPSTCIAEGEGERVAWPVCTSPGHCFCGDGLRLLKVKLTSLHVRTWAAYGPKIPTSETDRHLRQDDHGGFIYCALVAQRAVTLSLP
jgi:hypothetical protein